MSRRRFASIVVLGHLLAVHAPAQGVSFGPRPIYLRGSAFVWEFSFGLPAEEVFDAAVRIGKKHKLKLLSRDDASGTLRLARVIQRGGVLDEHCEYPIVGYYSWEPTSSYAQVQSQAFAEGQRMRGESMAQAARLNGAVNVLIQSRGENEFVIQSICSAFLRKWGVVEATSLGVVEKSYLEELATALGSPMEIPIPKSPPPEPSRENPARDFHTANRCQERCVPGSPCTGMYVDPESLELRCIGEAPIEEAQ